MRDGVPRRNGNGSLQQIHVAMLGLDGSGKSALTVKYMTKRFITEYDPNLEDTYCKHEIIHGRENMIWIMDTVESGARDPARYISWADVYMVCYSVTNPQSFEFAQQLLKRLSLHEHSLCVRPHSTCLVGNKVDMERYRQVSKSEGARLADEHGADFAEVTTTEDYAQVRALFHQAITTCVARRLRALQRSASAQFCESDPETTAALVGGALRLPTSLNPRSKSSASTPPKMLGLRRSKSPTAKLHDSLKNGLPPTPPHRKDEPKKSSPGLKLFKLLNKSGQKDAGTL